METIIIYTKILLLGFALTIAVYSALYKNRVYALGKKLPIPLNNALFLALKGNVILSWITVLVVLVLLLI